MLAPQPAAASVVYTKQWIGSPRFDNPSGVALAPSGSEYVADSQNDRIVKLDAQGALVAKWGSNGTGTGQFQGPWDVAADGSGNVYVADTFNNRIQEFDPSGTFILMFGKGVDQTTPGDVCTATSGDTCKAGTYGSSSAQMKNPYGIAIDSTTGDLLVADSGNNRIDEYDSSGVFVQAFGYHVNGNIQFESCTTSCSGGTVGTANGQFYSPFGVATDAAGDVYVADSSNNRIQEFNSSRAYVTKWGSSGGTAGQFSTPLGLVVDGSNDVWVADDGNNRVQEFSSSGSFILMFGKGVDQSNPGDLCTATSGDTCQAGTSGSGPGQFYGPVSVEIDGSGNVIVADLGNNRIETFTSALVFSSTVGTLGIGNTAGLFGYPQGFARDSAGNLFVADLGNNLIEEFDPSGSFIAGFGGPGDGAGQLDQPIGLAIDSSDDVWVDDRNNNRIDEFDSNGYFVLTIGKGVDQTTTGDICTADSHDVCQAGTSGPANGQFSDPEGIATDPSTDDVYVTDCGNNRVQKFSTLGIFLTTWGTLGSGNGQFNCAEGVAVDSAGRVYVSDANNYRIEKFTSSGAFLAKWGSSGSGDGQFSGPLLLTTDLQDNVYVADCGNNVQVFRPTGVFVKSWGEFGSGNGQFNCPTGVAVGSGGSVFVTDQNNNRVERFTETDTTPPVTTITSGPSGVINHKAATFGFSSNESGLFECRVDLGQYVACASPYTTPALTQGSHTFRVRSIDHAGNVEQSPASRTFKVDTLPPNTTITAGPSGATHDRTPTFRFRSSETGSTFRCSVDSGPFRRCTSPDTLRALSFGAHRFRVRAKDKAGNTDPTPASRRFRVVR